MELHHTSAGSPYTTVERLGGKAANGSPFATVVVAPYPGLSTAERRLSVNRAELLPIV